MELCSSMGNDGILALSRYALLVVVHDGDDEVAVVILVVARLVSGGGTVSIVNLSSHQSIAQRLARQWPCPS
jgi:hypothetical protein